MDQRNKNLFHLIALANLLIGALYFLFRYYIRVPSDFGERPSDFQPWFQYLHILLVIPWVFVFGMLFQTHILKKLKGKQLKKKRSGLSLVALSLLMIASGYFIQVFSPEWVGLSHVLFSGAWIFVYAWHTLRD